MFLCVSILYFAFFSKRLGSGFQVLEFDERQRQHRHEAFTREPECLRSNRGPFTFYVLLSSSLDGHDRIRVTGSSYGLTSTKHLGWGLRTVSAMLAMVSYISKYGRFLKFLLNLKTHKYV